MVLAVVMMMMMMNQYGRAVVCGREDGAVPRTSGGKTSRISGLEQSWVEEEEEQALPQVVLLVEAEMTRRMY